MMGLCKVQKLWGRFAVSLFAFVLGCSIGCAQETRPPLYWDLKAEGDHQFQKKEYFLAFEKYRQAARVFGADPEIHYRLGRVYGLLEPQKSLCEKEYTLAFHLFLRKFAGMDQVTPERLREFLSIPIDPYESDNPRHMNPRMWLVKDIDGDGESEAFVLMRRGQVSYSLFVLSYVDHAPKVAHLVTFYEGVSGDMDVSFKDVDEDGQDDVVVTGTMKDFFNLFIFKRKDNGAYTNVLQLPGLFLGSTLFVNVQGDALKEVEVYEKVREGIVFPQEEGPYWTKKSIYAWKGDRYELVNSEPVLDESYTLNEFFSALLWHNDFARAFSYVHPALFLERWDRGADMALFIERMRQADYRCFLAETPYVGSIEGRVKVCADARYDLAQGWEEGGYGMPVSPVIREDEKHYKIFCEGNSYSLVLRRRGRWLVESLVKDDVLQTGWEEKSKN